MFDGYDRLGGQRWPRWTHQVIFAGIVFLAMLAVGSAGFAVAPQVIKLFQYME